MLYDKNGDIFSIGDFVVCDDPLGPFPAGMELRVQVTGFHRVLTVAMIPLDPEFAATLTIVRRGDGSAV